MPRSPIAISTALGYVFFSCASIAWAQPAADAVYRVLSTKESRFQQELDRAAADGYRLVAGDAAFEVAILERVRDDKRRSYLFARDVEGFLKQKQVLPGFRLIPSTFSSDGNSYSAVFQKIDGDEQAREYGFVKARSPSALQKLFEKGRDGAPGVIAIAWGGFGAAAIFEQRTEATAACIIASGNTGALREQIQAAGKQGLCFVDSDGRKEAFYALAQCAGGASPDYDVIATTRTETFEKELNELAAKGLRLVAAGLVSIEKRVLMMKAHNIETVGVVERVVEPTPIVYRVLSTLRLGTLEQELRAVAAEGFRLVAFAIGPKEWIAVLAK